MKRLNNYLKKKDISKKKIFLSFVKFNELRNRGNFWISFLQTFINWDKLILYGGVLSLWLDRFYPQFPVLWIFGGLIIAMILIEIIKFFLGLIDFRWGLWKTEAEWRQKTDVVSPFNVEIKETLQAICDKLGIKHKFNNKWQEK